MKAQEQAEKEDSRLLLRAATIGGIMVEVALTLQITYATGFWAKYGLPPTQNYPTVAAIWPEPSPAFAIVALLFPFAYAIGFQYYFKTKRTVSPVSVLLWSALIDMLLCVDYLFRNPISSYSLHEITISPQQPMAQASLLATVSVGYLFVVVLLAAFSLAGTRLALGLSVGDIERKSYRITMPPVAAFSAFKAASNSNNLSRFRRIEADDNTVVLRKRYVTGDEIVVSFGFDRTNPKAPQTTLATVAYSKNAYGYLPSASASSTCKSIVNDILGRCVEKDANAKITPLDNTEDYASARAYAVAVSPARSKLSVALGFFLELERYFQYVLVATGLAFLAATVAAYYGFGKADYGDILTVLFVLMVGEVGLAIREERKHPKSATAWDAPS